MSIKTTLISCLFLAGSVAFAQTEAPTEPETEAPAAEPEGDTTEGDVSEGEGGETDEPTEPTDEPAADETAPTADTEPTAPAEPTTESAETAEPGEEPATMEGEPTEEITGTEVEGAGTETVEPADEAPEEPTEEEAVAVSTEEVFPLSGGLKLGASFAQPLSKLGTSFVTTVEVAYLLPWLEQRFAAFVGLGYVWPKHKDSADDPRVPGGEYTYKITEHELTLALGPMARLFPPKTQLNFYAQMALQIHFQRADAQGRAGPVFRENQETATRVGFGMAGGAEYLLGPGAIAAELTFSVADLDHEVAGESTAGGLGLQVGYHVLF